MAIESTNWPNWLKEIWPNWLENIDYPHSGVGDLDDLKLSIGIGQDGRWIGFINPGWYYHEDREQYNYVLVNTVSSFLHYGSSGTIVASGSFRPSWGPVLVYGVSDDASGRNDGPYREHHNSFYPGYSLNWSFYNSTTARATLPTSGILVGMRDETNLPLGAVKYISQLTNNKQYYYDDTLRRVYIKTDNVLSVTQPVWADLLYTKPILRFREIVVSEVDASGNAVVLPSYQQIEDVLAWRAGNYTTLVSGYHASGFITHTISGVYNGDWLVLDYSIAKSFVLRDHKTIQLYAGGDLASSYIDYFTIYHESSLPDLHPSITVNTPSASVFNVFNLNPLFEFGYRSGYLFHGTPASAIENYWVPTKLELYLDKSEVCSTWAEALKVKLLLTGDNGLPIPYYNIRIAVIGGSAILTRPASTTNGRGEVHYLVRPNIGATSLTIRASCNALYVSAIATVVASSTLITSTKWFDGFVHVVVTNDRTGRGAYRTFAFSSTADGLPRNSTIDFTSKMASEFHESSGKTLTKNITLSSSVNIPNIQALVEFGYVPQTNDSLFGVSNTGISKIIRSGS